MGGVLSKNAPNFRDFTDPRGARWQRPGDGLIGGEITDVGMDNFDLRSFDNQDWKISYDQKTEGVDDVQITSGEKVGIIGEKTGEFLMHAFSIRQFPSDWSGQPPSLDPMSPDQGGKFPNGFPPPLPPPF